MGFVLGLPNTYAAMPLKKMFIYPVNMLGSRKMVNKIEGVPVLFNPQTYRRAACQRMARFMDKTSKQQFVKSIAAERVDVDFFLDTFSAGAEILGKNTLANALDGLKFEVNAVKPSLMKKIDVNDYVMNIYSLCFSDEDLHKPLEVNLSWGSLDFNCYLHQCSVDYVKFLEDGTPVRAIMKCSFVGSDTFGDQEKKYSFNSPDTSKFHTIVEGESLNDISMIAYDNPKDWRIIAKANNITNPRILRTGQTVHMPAKV